MADTIRILVTFAEHSDPRLAEQALEGDPSLEVVGYADYFDDWREFLEQPADIVVVACSAGDESSTHMVDRAVKHRPDRPVVVMTESSPNGFLRSAFEAGADDVIPLPQSPVEVDQRDPLATLRERDREIRGGEGLARSALRPEDADES